MLTFVFVVSVLTSEAGCLRLGTALLVHSLRELLLRDTELLGQLAMTFFVLQILQSLLLLLFVALVKVPDFGHVESTLRLSILLAYDGGHALRILLEVNDHRVFDIFNLHLSLNKVILQILHLLLDLIYVFGDLLVLFEYLQRILTFSFIIHAAKLLIGEYA